LTESFSIDTPNGTIGGIDVGRGPVVVLLAGLGSTHRIWGDLPAVLGRRARVIALDNRGVGGSRDGAPFTLEGAAEDVLHTLDELGVDRASLIGVSMGGLIALTTAARRPEQVERLVLGSCAARLSSHGRGMIGLLRDLLSYLPEERIATDLMTLSFAPPFHDRYPAFITQAATLYGIDADDRAGAVCQAEHLLGGWDLRSQLSRLVMPAMVLVGQRDPIVAAEETEELARMLPFAELVSVPQAAHSVLAEGGVEVVERVLSFLSDQVG
jgi:3-oxoadipate enol-lactonase